MSQNDNKSEKTAPVIEKQSPPQKKHNIPKPSKVIEAERGPLITNWVTKK